MIKNIILTFVITFMTTIPTFAVDRIVDVVLLRTADSNGANASLATAAAFQIQIDAANIAYAGSGIQFKFDPVKGFPPIVNNTLMNRDFVLKAGETLNSPKDKQPKIDDLAYTTAKNEYIMKNYPGKLVVLSGAGNSIVWSDALNRWEITEVQGAYSNMVDRYVRWHRYDDSRNFLFAHEGGHNLHLGHVFGWQPETKADWQKLVTDYLANGLPEASIPSIFDGDGLADTPADPGSGLFYAINGQTCDRGGTLTLDYTYNGQKKYVTFAPDRTNVLSYFFCNNFTPSLSPMQKKRAFNSVEYGNRIYLRTSNPGINVARYSYDISAVSWGQQRIDIFASGSDLRLFHKAWDSTNGWMPDINVQQQWFNHLGESVGTPTVVAWGENRLDVFARTINGRIMHQAWNGQYWYPSDTTYEDMGGTVSGDIAAVAWGPNRLDLFARASDGNIYHKAWDGYNWWPSVTGWNSIGGGGVTSDPVAVSWGSNRLDIFVRGKNGDLLHKAWNGTNWAPSLTEWESLAGQIPFGSKPAVTAWSSNRLDIVVRGMDNAIWHKAWNGQGWSNWATLGGYVTSDPAMVSWSANRLDIVVRGGDSRLYHKAWDGQGWWPNLTGWYSLGGKVLEGTNPKIISWGPGRLDIFIRNTNFEIQHKSYENVWYPGLDSWETQGKYID